MRHALPDKWMPGHTVPHPDPKWREFGRMTLARMEKFGVHRFPWFDLDIWFWAASTNDGAAWVEREISYWAARMDRADEETLKTIRRLPILEPGDEAEYVDDYTHCDGNVLSFTEHLRAREEREARARRHRPW